jgi:CDGSH-type Zn-finger protein/uncharacterized Fe-S cluster protein YjdI
MHRQATVHRQEATVGRNLMYEDEQIRVLYDPKRCIHAAECVHGLPDVFDPDRRPWVEPDRGEPGEIADVIRRCPTGALHYERLDDGPDEEAPDMNVIVDAADGPLYMHGDIEIQTATGSLVAGDVRVALCRCGASANKPYCDNAHVEIGFKDDGEVSDLKIRPREEDAGPLIVKLLTDGPLLLSGPFELIAANLAACAVGGGAAMCRCGASSNKPFCDGTHKSIGFTPEDPGPAAT